MTDHTQRGAEPSPGKQPALFRPRPGESRADFAHRIRITASEEAERDAPPTVSAQDHDAGDQFYPPAAVTEAMKNGELAVPGALYSRGGAPATHLYWVKAPDGNLQAWRVGWNDEAPERLGEFADLDEFARSHPDAFVVEEEMCVWTTLTQDELPLRATVGELAYDDVKFEFNGESAGGPADDFANLTPLWSVHGEFGGTDATLVDGHIVLYWVTDMDPWTVDLDREMTPLEAAIHTFPPEIWPDNATVSSSLFTWDQVKGCIPVSDLNEPGVEFNGDLFDVTSEDAD